MTSMYARGRKQEYIFINKAKKYPELNPKRVLLSGQRGEGDVLLELLGKTLSVEVKARKEVPKTVYEWLGKHDLLAMKKVGQQYDWLVTLRLDDYLEVLAQSVRTPHKSSTADKSPTHVGGVK